MNTEAQALEYPVKATEEVADRRVSVDVGAHLLAQHLDGDSRAFAALVERYRAPIYGYLLRSGVSEAVADDLFQETFLRVHLSAARFRADSSFKTWLFTIAANLMRSHYRRQKVRRILVSWWKPSTSDGGVDGAPDVQAFDPPDDALPQDLQMEADDDMAWLSDELAKLPQRWRQAIILTKVEEMTLEEAAAVMSVPTTSIKTWVHRGRQALAKARLRLPSGEQQ